MTSLRFAAQEFRKLPSPVGKSRLGIFYCPAASLPRDLWDWREVNPREVNDKSQVFRAIAATLSDEPARFHERNRGISLVASECVYDEKRREVIVTLDDKSSHGVVDGAHTLHAILEAQCEPRESAWPAHVFVKVVTDVEPDQIAEIAGGLNTSQQVDLKSLENLRGHFSHLESVLKPESYAGEIGYKMNEAKAVDVREVLYYLAVFDCSEYSEKKHPVKLFGRKEGIVRKFAEQAAGKEDVGDSFNILISKAPEILRLRDLIEKDALGLAVGRYKAGKGVRVRSESNRENRLVFLDETVDGKIPLGWLMPILGAFRANVEWNRPAGTFSWIVPLEELVGLCIEQLVIAIKEVHEQENSRPEYVGRNSISWRITYNIVSQTILQWELKRERRK